MRRPEKTSTPEQAWAVFRRVPFVHVSGTDAEGQPILRALNHVVHDGGLWFHSAPKGEKLELIGRPVIASAVEDLGIIPSYAEHARRACPATTWYRSAQLSGVLEPVEDPVLRASALQAMMERLQPEGGYTPIAADLPMYRGALRGLAVMRLRGELVGKHSVGQYKPLPQRIRIAEVLWERGADGDVERIEAMRAASVDAVDPPFLSSIPGVRLRACWDERHAHEAVQLLLGTYWSPGRTPEEIVRSQRRASAWVGAEDGHGRLIGQARAVCDGVRFGWMGDVVVREAWRGRGLGGALVRLLLDHPAVRHSKRLILATQDPAFYDRFGFEALEDAPGRTRMARVLPA